MTYKKQYQDYMRLYEAGRKLEGWKIHHISSCSGQEMSTQSYSYKWFGTEGHIQMTGNKWESSWLEITVSADTEEELEKVCGVLERKLPDMTPKK